MSNIRTRYLVILAQTIEAKYMLGEEAPSTTDKWINAPAHDEECECECQECEDIKK